MVASSSRSQSAAPSSNCQASADPADVFVEIFDEVPEGLFLADEAERLGASAAVLAEATAVEQAVLRNGGASFALADLPAGGSRNQAALARLIGLDRILRYVHPHAEASPPKSLAPLAARYARKGRFNTSAVPGLLLPRLMDYGAPAHRPDKYELFSVVRVEPNRMRNVDFRTLGSQGWSTRKGRDDVVVACLPFLDTIADVLLERVEKFGRGRYRLGPSDDPRLEPRVDEAIAELDRSGAAIGLLPEGALSGTLLELWRRRLAETYSQGGSRLALVVAGTGPVTGEDPPRNQAAVLDRQGRLLWRQDKLCDYTLVRKTIKNWKLPNLGDGDLLEDITRGDKLVVVETTLGRLAILICEDLERSDTRQVVPRDLGVSHILVPVFDAPLAEQRWERFAAERHLNWAGSRVVVSNSRVVGNLQGGRTMLTALGMSPPRIEGTWEYDLKEIRATDSATQAVCVRLRAVGPPPEDAAVEPAARSAMSYHDPNRS